MRGDEEIGGIVCVLAVPNIGGLQGAEQVRYG
jgi:hypothetical protein